MDDEEWAYLEARIERADAKLNKAAALWADDMRKWGVRTHRIDIRVTPAEKLRIQKAADEAGATVSDWLRDLAAAAMDAPGRP